MGIASPYRAARSLGANPSILPDGAGASIRGRRGQQSHAAAAFTGLPLPIPRSRHYCLSVALWDGFPL